MINFAIRNLLYKKIYFVQEISLQKKYTKIFMSKYPNTGHVIKVMCNSSVTIELNNFQC